MTEREKWDAVEHSSAEADGAFYYAVKSTGIFCRPSCRSRKPSPGNVQFFDRAEDAVRAGYRPCKRCRPDLALYTPDLDVVERAKAALAQNLPDKRLAFGALSALGLTRHRLDQVFRAQTGVSPAEYFNRLRLDEAVKALLESDQSALEIAHSLGFESPSAFAAFFKKREGVTPSDFRKQRNAPGALRGAMAVYDTIFGPMTIADDGAAITFVRFGHEPGASFQGSGLTSRAAEQLNEYFSGHRTQFDLPFNLKGTPFQRAVWGALSEIPFGETRTYAQIAEAIGKPHASRAVGAACRENPMLVLIPCHRVLGSDGNLRGYAGGIDQKERLLALERALSRDNGPKEKS